MLENLYYSVCRMINTLRASEALWDLACKVLTLPECPICRCEHPGAPSYHAPDCEVLKVMKVA